MAKADTTHTIEFQTEGVDQTVKDLRRIKNAEHGALTGSRKLIAFSAALFCAVSLGVIEAKTGHQIPEQAFWSILGLFGSFAAGNGLEWLGKARAIGHRVAEEIDNEK